MSCSNNVGAFDDLDAQLQSVILEFLNNQNICKLIHYNTKDALVQPDVEDPTSLIETNIYTQTFIPPNDTETTYITVFFDSFDAVDGNPYLKHGRLYINVATHRSLWKIDGGQRVIQIMNEIDKILNKKRVTNSITKDFFKKASYRNISEFFNSYDILYTNIDVQ